jgi:aspartyl-tRNA(Asn)/glutamyl-tRNA(Gln) amidotransferase subunit C
MNLSRQEVEHIALLSRIELTEEEKSNFSDQLSHILEYVGQLEKLDTKDVSVTSRVSDLKNVLADDKVMECQISQNDLLANVPKKHDDYVEVKAILE